MSHNELMRETKKTHIIESSKPVFSRKGYSNVKMKDLIEASAISRGGIYLYFQSVEEVFIEIIARRERKIVDDVEQLMKKDVSFHQLLDAYLKIQADRLKNIHDSFLKASYEYQFTKANADFNRQKANNARLTIQSIILYGQKKGELTPTNPNELVEHILIYIEGLNISLLINTIRESDIDSSLDTLKEVIYNA
ncbi:TetR/AcrR family transcriptional regulator [Erysipelothrix urinaevulpis]|uniref:TetR/AcrR family transcriptional regulator n=1 Tax=Erysipelothrix urinaevulpis TaxID=2683717 RepID=UPI0013594167|nr:TetR/AcrR family transcriptional regulator [Erysipelothrix urinaevulpis]